MLVALVAAFVAGLLAWRHATRLDCLSLHEDWPGELREDQRAWRLTLGLLIAAVLAITFFQMALVARLQSLGQ
jgi:hypothetical protein